MDVYSDGLKSKKLHDIICDYNWDGGFKVPLQVILDNDCDLGTAILCFYRADGYRYLIDHNSIQLNVLNEEWFQFVSQLYIRIKAKSFKYNNISFIPDLTKVQKHKIRKVIPDIIEEFIDGVSLKDI